METVTLEQLSTTPSLGLEEYLAKLQSPSDAESSVVWEDLVASLRDTHELARLARGLAI